MQQIRRIESKFGDLPLAALAERGCRGEFKSWRDKLAEASRRQADYAFTVLARILAWALDRELAPANPCERAGRLYASTRAESVWTDADAAAFTVDTAAPLRLALMLALWTGQRQGDLLRLPWSAYDGERINSGRARRAPMSTCA